LKRLFFALWPDDHTRQQCFQISKAIGNNAKLVQATNLHVTLVFLGNITADKEIALRQTAATTPIPTLTLCFNQLSFWKKPSILCLTATESDPELLMLVDQLSMLVQNLGIPVDERPYQPHVTLAKKAKELVTLEFKPITWHSETFCLVESCASPTGVHYRVIEKWGNK
jgi:2'-5' RNA ligase